MKNMLNDKYGIYPLVTRHPALKTSNNRIRKKIKINRDSFLGALLKANSLLRKTVQGKKDIISIESWKHTQEESVMKIMPNRMDRGFFKYQEEFENKAVEVLRSG